MSSILERVGAAVRYAVRTVRPVRFVVHSQPIQHVIRTLRAARKMHAGMLFVCGELFLVSREADYVVRASGLRVFVRHRTRDIDIFTEIFVRGEYEPPPPIDHRLRREPCPSVLDLGANIGLFCIFIRGLYPGAQLTAIEPDPSNFDLLKRCAQANWGAGGWELVEACASNRAGNVDFASGLFADSHVVPEGEMGSIQVPAVDVFGLGRSIDLLKMDIEGAEWPILEDPRFVSLDARAIVLEWHGRASPHPNPRDAAIAALLRSGFEIAKVTDLPPPRTGESGMIWALRP